MEALSVELQQPNSAVPDEVATRQRKRVTPICIGILGILGILVIGGIVVIIMRPWNPRPKKIHVPSSSSRWVEFDDAFQSFISRSLANCTCKQNNNCDQYNITFVSSLVNIGKPGRGFDDYIKHMQELLTKFYDIPFVFFMEPGHREGFMGNTWHNPNRLCLIDMSIKEVPDYMMRDLYLHAFASMKFKKGYILEPEMSLPEYDMIMHNKPNLVHIAANNNPFGSEIFAWVDGGLHFGMDSMPAQENVKPITSGDRISIGFTKPDKEVREFIRTHTTIDQAYEGNNMQMGAVFSGTRKAVMKLAEPYHKLIVEEYLKQDVMDDDQGPMARLWFARPDLFENCHCKGYDMCPSVLLGNDDPDAKYPVEAATLIV